MLARQCLFALTTQVDEDLHLYLKKINYQLIAIADKNSLDECKRKATNWATLRDDDRQQYIFVSCSQRNPKLIAERVHNLLVASEQLQTKKQALSQMKLDEVEVQEYVHNLQEIVQTAIEANSELNRTYKKDHFSFHQNRLAGMGIFASWWHKTIFQSRAEVALEVAMHRIENFAQLVWPARQTISRPS